jgi:hypothetical protein
MPKLAHSLNRPVIVAIPAFFGDDAPRRCTLVDIEPAAGLWFRSDALNEQLGTFKDAAPPPDTLATVFFPFDQIVFVFDPAQFARVARGLGLRATPTKLEEPPPRATRRRSGRHRDGRSKQKNSKPTR